MRLLSPVRASVRPAALALAAACLVVALAGCRPPADRADPRRPVEVVLLTTPARVGPAAIEIRLTVDGTAASGASVGVVGDMTHAGMTPVVAPIVTEVAPGVYRTRDFAFDMVGDWEITADVRYADGVRRTGVLRLRVER